MATRLIGKWLVIISFVGMILSGYALAHHYEAISGDFCTLSEDINCDIVNKSLWSEIYGVPVALIGLLGYAFIGAIGLKKIYEKSPDITLTKLLVAASIGGLLFSLYLTYVEFFILGAACLVCIGSQLCIATNTVLSVKLLNMENKLNLKAS